MTVTRIFLLINAVGWAAFGLICFIHPNILVELLGANTVSHDGLFELRSIYGGTSLGAAALFFSGFLKEHMQRPALYFIVAYMGGYAAARLGAALIMGLPGANLMGFWALEIFGAGVSLYLLRKNNA